MSVTTLSNKDRHLTVVPGLPDASAATEVLDHLAELDADHATACDVYDLAAADLKQARKELTEAARSLADAEERCARAGIVADETNRAVIGAREAAGLVLTASGYRKDTR